MNAFALGFIAGSFLWIGVYFLGLAAIRKHRPARADYGRCNFPPVPSANWPHVSTPALRTIPPTRHRFLR